jgi:FkbM family methyltransferase
MLTHPKTSSSSLTTVDFAEMHIGIFKHTEHSEQMLIRSFFSNANTGFFVDIGANDPFHNSQTYHLEQLGWRGIVVEPLPEMASRLEEKRSAVVDRRAVSSKANLGKQLMFKRAGVVSALKEPDEKGRPNSALETEFPVWCTTLDSILEEHEAPTHFELLSIDVEGHEPEVLDGFSIQKWKPKLILIEDHVVNLRTHSWLRNNSYQLILRTGVNSWYVSSESSCSMSLLARLQRLRKMYLGLPFRRLRNRIKTSK